MNTELRAIAVVALAALTGIGCDLTDVNETGPGTSGGVSPNWYPANIYTVRVDGTDLVQLTTDAKSFLPRYSPDGTKILFLTTPLFGDESTDLNRMNSDGSGREVLATDASAYHQVNRYFAQSPDGSSICYPRHANVSGDPYSQRVELVVLAYATGNRLRITSYEFCQDPDFSFDGSRILFQKIDWSGASPGIYSVAIDGTGITRCYLPPSGTALYSCSPAADRVLVSDESGLFTVNSAGNNRNTLSPDFQYCSSPRFSSDGTRATFEWYGSIYVVNVNGGVPVSLAAGNQPSYSPDGRIVAFVKNWNTLCTVNFDGTGERVLVTASSGIHDPGFSPDGTRILFWQDA